MSQDKSQKQTQPEFKQASEKSVPQGQGEEEEVENNIVSSDNYSTNRVAIQAKPELMQSDTS